MRLSREKIDILADKIVDEIKANDTFTSLGDEKAILAEIKNVILADLKREDDLEVEVEEILAPYRERISSRSMNYNILVRKAKSELAKRKGIVI